MAFGTDIPSIAWRGAWIGVFLIFRYENVAHSISLKEVDPDAGRIKIRVESK